MTELTVAVVGCEGLGRLHLNGWKPQSGVRVAGLYDADGVRVSELAKSIPGSAGFTEIKDLLSAESYDIVDVCLPLEDRALAIEAALKSGANVLAEAPFAISSKESNRLVEMARDRERLLMPALVHRFHPPVLFLKELLENDDIGTPVSFRCRFSDTRNFFGGGAAESPVSEQIGVVLSTALHGIDLFQWLIGETGDISGMTHTITPGLAFEDNAVILLKAKRGTLGVVEASQRLPGSRNLLEIYGTVGAALLDYDTNLLRYRTMDDPFWVTHDAGGVNSFEGALAHFADSIRGLQILSVSGEDAVRAQALCERVRG